MLGCDCGPAVSCPPAQDSQACTESPGQGTYGSAAEVEQRSAVDSIAHRWAVDAMPVMVVGLPTRLTGRTEGSDVWRYTYLSSCLRQELTVQVGQHWARNECSDIVLSRLPLPHWSVDSPQAIAAALDGGCPLSASNVQMLLRGDSSDGGVLPRWRLVAPREDAGFTAQFCVVDAVSGEYLGVEVP